MIKNARDTPRYIHVFIKEYDIRDFLGQEIKHGSREDKKIIKELA